MEPRKALLYVLGRKNNKKKFFLQSFWENVVLRDYAVRYFFCLGAIFCGGGGTMCIFFLFLGGLCVFPPLLITFLGFFCALAFISLGGISAVLACWGAFSPILGISANYEYVFGDFFFFSISGNLGLGGKKGLFCVSKLFSIFLSRQPP